MEKFSMLLSFVFIVIVVGSVAKALKLEPDNWTDYSKSEGNEKETKIDDLERIDVDDVRSSTSTETKPAEESAEELLDRLSQQSSRSNAEEKLWWSLFTANEAPGDDELVPNSNGMFRDWRDSGCISRIRNQDTCGACTATSYVALLEFEYCRQMGEPIMFSAQYYIDCGSQFDPIFEGCEGMTSWKFHQLVEAYGVITTRQYPEYFEQRRCPVPPNWPSRRPAQFRPKIKFEPGIRTVTNIPLRLSRMIKSGPVVVGISTPADFAMYFGGVHPGNNCDPNSDHQVIIVGDGIENGQRFWLIRNSFGQSWGEDGYFKLAKSATRKCIASIMDWEIEFPKA